MIICISSCSVLSAPALAGFAGLVFQPPFQLSGAAVAQHCGCLWEEPFPALLSLHSLPQTFGTSLKILPGFQWAGS